MGDILRTILAAALATFIIICCKSQVSAAELIHLDADRITFYYDRFLVEADGNVRVQLDDGTAIEGETFSMDAKLNRFVVAGNVSLKSPTGDLHGAAVADFLNFSRVYFVPITAKPDRWTYLDGDFAHPQKGREMPGDTFFLPDLSRDKPFIYAHHATISPNVYIAFRPAQVSVGVAYVPTPSYVINFSTNANLAQNSLSGATADATYPFAGSNNSISALHLRYDPYDRGYLAFEQHLATDKKYAIFSVNPMNRPSKFWNLLLYDRFSERSQVQTFTQLHTFQSGLSLPVESSQYTNVTYTQAFRQSYVQVAGNFYNQSLLERPATGYFGDPSHTFNAAHPLNVQATWTGFDHRIGKLPLYERIRYGLLYAHDQYGIQGYAAPSTGLCSQDPNSPNYCGTNFQPFGVGTTLWENNAGITLYTPSIRIGHSTFLSAVFDKQRRWGPPHYVDATNTTVSASRTYGTKLAAYLAYNVYNLADVYGAQQAIAYPSYVPVVNGVAYPGFAAFQGIATYRTLTGAITFTPNPNVALAVTAQKHRDFPEPIEFYYGQPPYTATADLRMRVNSHMLLDFQRSYYFNFANQRWSPQWVIQVLP